MNYVKLHGKTENRKINPRKLNVAKNILFYPFQESANGLTDHY